MVAPGSPGPFGRARIQAASTRSRRPARPQPSGVAARSR
jgi:hypothetical protein